MDASMNRAIGRDSRGLKAPLSVPLLPVWLVGHLRDTYRGTFTLRRDNSGTHSGTTPLPAPINPSGTHIGTHPGHIRALLRVAAWSLVLVLMAHLGGPR